MGVKLNRYFYLFFKIIINFLVIFLFLTHCASKTNLIREDEREVLRNRIKEYWLYQINGNVEKAYQCEVPVFREKVSIIGYLNRFKLIKYLESDVLEVDINGDEADSTVRLTYRMLLKKIERKSWSKIEKERWIREKNIWYHIPEGFETTKK